MGKQESCDCHDGGKMKSCLALTKAQTNGDNWPMPEITVGLGDDRTTLVWQAESAAKGWSHQAPSSPEL